MLTLLAIAGPTSGCFWLVAGGAGAEAGYVAGQGDRTAGDTLTDQWIHAKIKTELMASSVASRKLDIKVRKGKVTLTGVLSSADEKSSPSPSCVESAGSSPSRTRSTSRLKC